MWWGLKTVHVGEEHAENNEDSNHSPDPLDGGLGMFMKKKTHSGTILPYAAVL